MAVSDLRKINKHSTKPAAETPTLKRFSFTASRCSRIRRRAHLDFRTRLHLLLLRDGVGHHHGLERRVVDARDGRTGENAVREDGVDFDGAGLDQPADAEN